MANNSWKPMARFCRRCGMPLDYEQQAWCPSCGGSLRPRQDGRGAGWHGTVACMVLIVLGALGFIIYAHGDARRGHPEGSPGGPMAVRSGFSAVGRPGGSPVRSRRSGAPSATATRVAGRGPVPVAPSPISPRSTVAPPGPAVASPASHSSTDDAVDQRALSTPRGEEKSVESIAAWLNGVARTDRERARAAFRWVTSRIRYDVEAYRSVCRGNAGQIPPQDVDMVLLRRTAVCAGYARLYEALGKAMGLEVVVVRGHCRTSASLPWQPYGPSDAHAWNAVRIDGHWALLDSTWGSGHLDAATGRFEPQFQPFYFLTPPNLLVTSHLPQDDQWQLLTPPLTESQQKSRPMVSAAAYSRGFRVPEQTHVRVRVGGVAQMRFHADPGTVLGATLRPAGAAAGSGLEGATFVEREGEAWSVLMACPGRGNYVLEIYVGGAPAKDNEPTTLHWATAYHVESTEAARNPSSFPRQYGVHGRVGARLVSPRFGLLQARRAQRFDIVVPGATDMVVFNGSQQVPMHRDGQRFTCDVEPLPTALALGARFDRSSDRYTSLVQYEVR